MNRELNIKSNINGGVFCYDVLPVNAEDNISNIIKEADDFTIKSFKTTSDLIKLKIIAFTGNSKLKPTVTCKGNEIELEDTEDFGVFLGEIEVNTLHLDEITIKHEDGARHTVKVFYEEKPLITTLEFIEEYPGTQTEFKAGDLVKLHIVSDSLFTQVFIYNYGAFDEQVIMINETSDVTLEIPAADRGDVAQNLEAMVKIFKANGTGSDEEITSNTVILNNLHPFINIENIEYPAGQGALKNNESAIVFNTVNDFDSILYYSNGELDIPNSEVYENKTVTRIAGDYNDNVFNFTIKATRAANGAESIKSTTVKIANVFANIKMINSAPYYRSGGNDNTALQHYLVKLESDQELIEMPQIDELPSGRWLNDFATEDYKNFIRTIEISDDDVKGIYNYTGVVAKNLAGLITTSININYDSYEIRGFVKRNLTLQAFENEVTMHTEAINYNNVTLKWNIKDLPIKEPVGTTETPIANAWTLDALSENPVIVRILDTAATSNVSQPSLITIEEV